MSFVKYFIQNHGKIWAFRKNLLAYIICLNYKGIFTNYKIIKEVYALGQIQDNDQMDGLMLVSIY